MNQGELGVFGLRGKGLLRASNSPYLEAQGLGNYLKPDL